MDVAYNEQSLPKTLIISAMGTWDPYFSVTRPLEEFGPDAQYYRVLNEQRMMLSEDLASRQLEIRLSFRWDPLAVDPDMILAPWVMQRFEETWRGYEEFIMRLEDTNVATQTHEQGEDMPWPVHWLHDSEVDAGEAHSLTPTEVYSLEPSPLPPLPSSPPPLPAHLVAVPSSTKSPSSPPEPSCSASDEPLKVLPEPELLASPVTSPEISDPWENDTADQPQGLARCGGAGSAFADPVTVVEVSPSVPMTVEPPQEQRLTMSCLGGSVEYAIQTAPWRHRVQHPVPPPSQVAPPRPIPPPLQPTELPHANAMPEGRPHKQPRPPRPVKFEPEGPWDTSGIRLRQIKDKHNERERRRRERKAEEKLAASAAQSKASSSRG